MKERLPKKEENKEDTNNSRRSFLKGVASTIVASVMPGGINKAEAHPLPRGPNVPEKFKEVYDYMLNFYSELDTLPEVEKQGAWIAVDSLKIDEVPVPDPRRVLGALGKDSALIIIKKLNTFILLYKDKKSGEVKVHKGPVGTGKVGDGYYTPEGVYKVHRKEGPNYKARAIETRGADMGYAVFFNQGIAFHRSENYRTLGGDLFLKRDNSHGCANGTEKDAIKVHKQMQLGEYVVVLP